MPWIPVSAGMTTGWNFQVCNSLTQDDRGSWGNDLPGRGTPNPQSKIHNPQFFNCGCLDTTRAAYSASASRSNTTVETGARASVVAYRSMTRRTLAARSPRPTREAERTYRVLRGSASSVTQMVTSS